MHTTLLITTITLSLLLGVMVLFTRKSLFAEAALATALAGFVGSLALDWLVLNNPGEALAVERLSLIANGLACWALVGFSMTFGRSYDNVYLPRIQLVTLILLLALPLIPIIFPPSRLLRPAIADMPWIIPLTSLGFIFHIAMMAALILALYNLEATLAGATHAKRWRIKFFVLGSMAVATSQFLSATPGLLYRNLDLSLSPSREFGLLLGVLLMGFSLLTRGGQVKIVFSQRLAYKSLVVLLAGVYLVGIGLLGKSGVVFPEPVISQAALGLALAGGFFLLAVLLSETIRRKVGVTLRKYFYKDKYDYRLQWLSYTQRLASAAQNKALYQAVLEGFCETFGIAQAVLFLRGNETSTFVPAHQLELALPKVPIRTDHIICPAPNRKLSVKDLRRQPPPPPFTQASFSVPLILDGALEGFILLGRPINPNEDYDEEDFELMEAMARQSFLAIRNLNLASELARAREMEIMGKVSAFMLHDLKNLVYTLSLMLENAKQYLSEPTFQQDMFNTLNNTVTRMKLLISQLKGLPNKENLCHEDVDLLDLVMESAKTIPDAMINVKGSSVSALIDREEMGKVLVNLLRNAHEACHGHDQVEVEVGGLPQPYVKIKDTGCGINEEFLLSNLFVPFSTTKENGMGIGLYQSKHIIEAHNGRLEVESSPGHGSTFTILLPELRTA